MEVLLPIFLVGGLFIVSNSDTSKNTESFTPLENTADISNLEHNELSYREELNHKDKFINPVISDPTKEGGTYSSLTGEPVTLQDFKHNNMQPFFGRTVRQQNSNFDRSEAILDHRIGTGSQSNQKREISALFAPEKQISHAFGTPNSTSFMQNRMNAGMTRNNEKPFESVQVGPGMNSCDKVNGSGGFNAGMENREKWMPRNVDQLRVKSNPRQSFKGVVLGGKAPVTNRGKMGNFEQYGPDRFFKNNPDRYFTTTGVEKAPRDRCSKQVFRPVNRIDTTTDYFGHAQHDQQASYVPGTFQPSERPELASNFTHVSNVSAADRHRRECMNDIDAHRNSQTTNNRNISGPTQLGVATSLVHAIVSPLMDTLRPSRKSNIIGNNRGPGNATSLLPNARCVNPNDRARTTIREMTEKSAGHVFVGNQNGSGTHNNPSRAVPQQRDTTTKTKHIAPSHGFNNPVSYESAFNANLIDKSVISQGRDPKGSGVSLPAGVDFMNIQPTGDACENRMNGPMIFQGGQMPPSASTFGVQTTRQEIIPENRNSCEVVQALQDNPYHLSITR